MAREWSLQETKVLVEEHIALKEEEKLESLTASEHWNKVAKKLREKGFYRSHKSCNKRWYRLEQCEVQIFSFNMEEGKNNKNYWDLTRAERLEYRNKWPQLPSGDGIDKEMFDLLKNFSHQFEKNDKLESTNTSTGWVDNKEVTHTKPNIEINRQSAPPPPVVASPHLTPRILPRTIIASGEEQLKPQEESTESQKQSTNNWPAISEQPPLSSHRALDGFKLQARELRRRRAAEFRKNNRTVPYNSTHTTFMKGLTQPSVPSLPSQNPPSMTETTTFGSITVTPIGENPIQNLPKDPVTQTKPPIQFKRLFNPSPNSYKMDTNQDNNINKNANPLLPTHQQPIGSHLNFQSQSAKPGKHLLNSINSHLPLLQPKDNHSFNKNMGVMNSDVNRHQELFQLGSLEEQLQVILGVHHGSLQTNQNCEQQLHKNTDGSPHFGASESQGSATASLLGVAVGGLGVQLGAIVKLLQAKHAAEQEFQEKILRLVECMVVSLRTMAQANGHSSS